MNMKRIWATLAIISGIATPLPAVLAKDPKPQESKYADAVESGPKMMKESLTGSLTDMASKPDENRNPPKKPLGLYFGGLNIQYKSPYAKEPAKTMATFAYDLNEFKGKNGCGFASCKDEMAKKDDVDKAWNKTHMSYVREQEYARSWWTKTDPSFAKDSNQDLWIQESLLDGTYLFDKFREKTGERVNGYMQVELKYLSNKT